MSKGKRYTQEFKTEAVKQITERGYSVFSDTGLVSLTGVHNKNCVYSEYQNKIPKKILKDFFWFLGRVGVMLNLTIIEANTLLNPNRSKLMEHYLNLKGDRQGEY